MTSVTLPEVEAFSREEFPVTFNVIGTEYLRTMGAQLVRGRTLGAQDRQGQPLTALVNESFVRRYFPNSNPLGKHIRTGEREMLEIVGVVGDIRYESAGTAAEPALYRSYQQQYVPNLTLQVRTSGEPHALIPLIRREFLTINAGLAGSYETLSEMRARSEIVVRLVSTLLSIFGALALLLASLGLYGVTAYLVALRTHEIGVRMALGARPRGVLKLMARQGLRLTVVGGVIGLLLALAAGRLLSNALYGVNPFDPVMLAGVIVVMGSVALLASVLPARRAARVDPLVALRVD
jgi:putative ABC transport system permease protein